MKTKVCSRCKKEKPLSEFYKNKARPDGYNNYCKKCFNDYVSGIIPRNGPRFPEPREGYKYCTKCGLELPLDEFDLDNHKKGIKRQSWCKKCKHQHYEDNFEHYSESRKLYNEEHSEELKEYHRIYYIEHKEEFKIRNKIYYQEHKDIIKKRASEWDANNRDRKNKTRNEWRHNNPDKYLSERLKRKERLNNVIHTFTADEYLDKLNDTNGICQMCGEYVGIENLTLDHILPISKAPKGFEYTIDDIQFLCRSCNSKKGNKIPLYLFM